MASVFGQCAGPLGPEERECAALLEAFPERFSAAPDFAHLWSPTPYGKIVPGTHSHEDWEVRILLRGRMPWPDGPGPEHPTCLLIPPRRLHRDMVHCLPRPAQDLVVLVVHGDGGWRLWHRWDRLWSGNCDEAAARFLGRRPGALLDAVAEEDPGPGALSNVRELQLRSLFTLVAAEASERLHGEGGGPPPSGPVERAEHFMRARYTEPGLTVAEIARSVGCTPEHLAHAFRRERDRTVRASLIRLRLEEARRLLIDGRYRVNEVAYLTGWNSPYHFSTRFRAAYGCAPSRLRKSGAPVPDAVREGSGVA